MMNIKYIEKQHLFNLKTEREVGNCPILRIIMQL